MTAIMGNFHDAQVRPSPDLAAALAAFQAELPAIHKGETANVVSAKGRYSYSYASLGDISKVVLPLLGKHGLSFMTMPTLNHDGRFVLRYLLLHSSGGYETGEYPLTGNTPQETGSSITYARRYTLCSVTGVAPDDDDDGAAASTVHATTPAAPYTPTPAEIRSVIATIGKGKGMDPEHIASDFESWSGVRIGVTNDVKILGDYLDYLRSDAYPSTEDGAK